MTQKSNVLTTVIGSSYSKPSDYKTQKDPFLYRQSLQAAAPLQSQPAKQEPLQTVQGYSSKPQEIAKTTESIQNSAKQVFNRYEIMSPVSTNTFKSFGSPDGRTDGSAIVIRQPDVKNIQYTVGNSTVSQRTVGGSADKVQVVNVYSSPNGLQTDRGLSGNLYPLSNQVQTNAHPTAISGHQQRENRPSDRHLGFGQQSSVKMSELNNLSRDSSLSSFNSVPLVKPTLQVVSSSNDRLLSMSPPGYFLNSSYRQSSDRPFIARDEYSDLLDALKAKIFNQKDAEAIQLLKEFVEKKMFPQSGLQAPMQVAQIASSGKLQPSLGRCPTVGHLTTNQIIETSLHSFNQQPFSQIPSEKQATNFTSQASQHQTKYRYFSKPEPAMLSAPIKSTYQPFQLSTWQPQVLTTAATQRRSAMADSLPLATNVNPASMAPVRLDLGSFIDQTENENRAQAKVLVPESGQRASGQQDREKGLEKKPLEQLHKIVSQLTPPPTVYSRVIQPTFQIDSVEKNKIEQQPVVQTNIQEKIVQETVSVEDNNSKKTEKESTETRPAELEVAVLPQIADIRGCSVLNIEVNQLADKAQTAILQTESKQVETDRFESVATAPEGVVHWTDQFNTLQSRDEAVASETELNNSKERTRYITSTTVLDEAADRKMEVYEKKLSELAEENERFKQSHTLAKLYEKINSDLLLRMRVLEHQLEESLTS